MAKKKPLIEWMECGDPNLVPIVMGDDRSTAASYFGVPVRLPKQSASFTQQQASPITTEMILQKTPPPCQSSFLSVI